MQPFRNTLFPCFKNILKFGHQALFQILKLKVGWMNNKDGNIFNIVFITEMLKLKISQTFLSLLTPPLKITRFYFFHLKFTYNTAILCTKIKE